MTQESIKFLKFQNPTRGELLFAEVLSEIVEFMRAEPQAQYRVMIGSDSNGFGLLDVVSVVAIHRVGNGGRYFWRRIELDPFHTLRDRIWQEVLISLDVAKEFITHLQGDHVPKFDFEIHIDVGENGATRTMIQELVGMVCANNFEARTKPFSCAASNVADRHVKAH